MNLTDFTQRLLPLTYFRRNAGEVLEKLPEVGTFILTKDGKPIAELTDISRQEKPIDTETNLNKLKSLAGGLKLKDKLNPSEINKIINNRYAKVLPR